MSEPLPLAAAAERLRGKPGRPRLSDEAKQRSAEQRRQRREAALAAVTPRLLDIPAAGKYLGVSTWVLRDLIDNGTIHRVAIPGADGGDLRRVLIDRGQLDRLIDVWKGAGG